MRFARFGPLPETLLDFTHIVHKYFPCIIDTKHLLSANPNLNRKVRGQTSLGDAFYKSYVNHHRSTCTAKAGDFLWLGLQFKSFFSVKRALVNVDGWEDFDRVVGGDTAAFEFIMSQPRGFVGTVRESGVRLEYFACPDMRADIECILPGIRRAEMLWT